MSRAAAIIASADERSGRADFRQSGSVCRWRRTVVEMRRIKVAGAWWRKQWPACRPRLFSFSLLRNFRFYPRPSSRPRVLFRRKMLAQSPTTLLNLRYARRVAILPARAQSWILIVGNLVTRFAGTHISTLILYLVESPINEKGLHRKILILDTCNSRGFSYAVTICKFSATLTRFIKL
jgi:hypothetical protein